MVVPSHTVYHLMQQKVIQSLQSAMKGKKLIRMCHTLEMGLEQIVLPIPQEIWYKYPSLDEDIIKPHVSCHRPFPNRDRDRDYTYDSVLWKILADGYLKNCNDELLFFSFKKSTNLEEACQEYGFKEFMPPYKLYKEIQDKKLLSEFGVTKEYGEIPFMKEKVQEIEYEKLCEHFGKKFVVQYSVSPEGFNSSGGRDTYIIDNKERYREIQQKNYDVPARISLYVHGTEMGINAVATMKGTFLFESYQQIIGVPELTQNPSMFCGVDYTSPIDAKAQEEMQRIARHIGKTLHLKQYRGIFGIDFLVEEKTNKVYVLEINPRFTAATNMLTFFLHAQGLLSPMEIHFSEYLDCFPEGFSVEEYEGEITGKMSGSFLYIRNREGKTVQALEGPKPGIYTLAKDDTLSFARDAFSIDQVQNAQEVLVRHVHTSRRNIGPIETICMIQMLGGCTNGKHAINVQAKKIVEQIYGQFTFAPENHYQSSVPYRTDIPG
jgi:hypothetical protein